jgi:hypothetical protein
MSNTIMPNLKSHSSSSLNEEERLKLGESAAGKFIKMFDLFGEPVRLAIDG